MLTMYKLYLQSFDIMPIGVNRKNAKTVQIPSSRVFGKRNVIEPLYKENHHRYFDTFNEAKSEAINLCKKAVSRHARSLEVANEKLAYLLVMKEPI